MNIHNGLFFHDFVERARQFVERAAHGRSPAGHGWRDSALLAVAGKQRMVNATHQMAVMMNEARVSHRDQSKSDGPPKISA